MSEFAGSSAWIATRASLLAALTEARSQVVLGQEWFGCLVGGALNDQRLGTASSAGSGIPVPDMCSASGAWWASGGVWCEAEIR